MLLQNVQERNKLSQQKAASLVDPLLTGGLLAVTTAPSAVVTPKGNKEK